MPPKHYQLQKGIKDTHVVDQVVQRSFANTIREAVALHGDGASAFEGADVVTSADALRILIAFVDGTMTEDMRSKGMNTKRRSDAALVDLCRISRIPEAPEAITLGTVYNWQPQNRTPGTGALNRRSYDVSFERVATGRGPIGGPPSIRISDDGRHFRVLRYKLGDLTLVVQVQVVATIPSAEADDFERPGQGVDLFSTNYRDAGDLWSSDLPSRLARMQVSDVGMIARGIIDKGTVLEMQDVTVEDLKLDRPSLSDDAAQILGRLVGLLRGVKEVVACPGCQDRPFWLQYSDAELRVISPRLDDDEDFDEAELKEETESQEVLATS